MNDLFASLFRSLVPIFVLMMIGLGLRRLGAVGKKGTDQLSRAVIYFLFPVFVFHRLALTEDPATIFSNYMIHIWAVIMLPGSALIGYAMHRLTHESADLRTFVFSVGTPNWIYLPLAFAGFLWGEEAVRLLILFNIPTQVMLWSLGVWLLHGSMKGTHALKLIALNPGLIATLCGILTAFGILPVTLTGDGKGLSLAGLVPLMHTIGGLTIPLSIVALGLYLGEKTEARSGAKREVLRVTFSRLIIAPIILGGLIMLASLLGVETSQLTRWILYVIISMPVAMSVPIFVQMFGGDQYLASRSVVFSTVFGLFTSTAFVLAAIQLEVLLGIASSAVLNQPQ